MSESTSVPITKEDVRRAILELGKTKEKVTNESIRNVLQRGSFSTIHKYRQQIIAEREISEETTVSARILAMVESISEAITEEARLELSAKKSEFKTAINTANNEIEKLKKEAEDLAILLEEEKALNKGHRSTILSQENSIKEMQREIESQEAEIRTYASVVAEKDSRISDLDKSVRHAQDTLEHFRKAAKSQREQDQIKYDADINSKMLELKQAREEASLYLNANTQLEKSLVRTTEKLESESSRCKTLEAESNKYEIRLAEANKQLQRSLEAATVRREEYLRDKEALNSHIAQLKEQLSTLSSQLISTEKERDLALRNTKESSDLRAQLEDLRTLVKGLTSQQSQSPVSK